MRTLFAQVFAATVASLFVLTVVMGVLFYVGVRRSISDWNIYRDQRLQTLIVPILSRTYRQQGQLDREAIEQAVIPFLTQNQYVYVFRTDRQPVFLYSRGDLLDPAEFVVDDSGRVEGLPGGRPPSALLQADEIVGYLSAGTLGFMNDPANRRFLVSMIGTLAVVVLVSFGLASSVAGLLSRRISRQAATLSEGLGRLAKGVRSVVFPTGGAQEMRSIADSASSLQDQLLHEERLRRQWAQDISHDLRTPVTALKTQFEAMMEGIVEPTGERLAMVFAEVCRIEDLVNDLRELSRIESPEQKLDIADLDPVSVARSIETRFERVAAERNADLRFDVQSGSFRGDEHLLNRALSNVVLNAIQHCSSNGQVDFVGTAESDGVIFDVANSGFVDEKTIQHVFDRLYRGENSRGSRGTGLGLSITRAIVEAHGGSVSMHQRETATHVQIRLPRG